jgi:hypothetical protein
MFDKPFPPNAEESCSKLQRCYGTLYACEPGEAVKQRTVADGVAGAAEQAAGGTFGMPADSYQDNKPSLQSQVWGCLWLSKQGFVVYASLTYS